MTKLRFFSVVRIKKTKKMIFELEKFFVCLNRADA